MSAQVLLNLLIAFVWMLLTSWDPASFFGGYIIGLGFIFVLRRFFHKPLYIRKVYAIGKLLLLFLKELVLSNINVIKHIITPKLTIRPGIFAYHTELKTDWEITILSCLISLTPGTLTLEVSPDSKTLYIHAMDLPDYQEAVGQIRRTFEKTILEVSR